MERVYDKSGKPANARLTYLTRRLPGPPSVPVEARLDDQPDIRAPEIAIEGQKRQVQILGQRIRKTVAEIERILRARFSGDFGLGRSDRNEFDRSSLELLL